jgi:mono/diheme cytochrome c family protein
MNNSTDHHALRRLDRLWSILAPFAWATFLVVVVIIVIGGSYTVWRLNDDRPVTYTSDLEHFKYGSTGGERGWKTQFGFGIPYWMWVALPELVPDLLPDGQRGKGYTALGVMYEEGRNPVFDLPVGTSLRRVQGIDRVYLNCAFCHTGSVRDAPDSPPMLVPGAPSNTVNLGEFANFLGNAAKARQFRDRELMAKIAALVKQRESWLETQDEAVQERYWPAAWGFIDRAIMRWVGVMALRDQLLSFMGRLEIIDFSTAGPGRVDTFNSPKALLGFDMHGAGVDPDELYGNVDFPSVWYQKARRGMQLHWDGNQCSTDERNLSAAFGTGATPATLDREKLRRVADYLWQQASPPPFPPQYIDSAQLARGESLYRGYCWQCHGNGRPPFRQPGDGSRVGTVEPIEAIATDRGRLDSYTPQLAVNQNTIYAGFPEKGEEHCRAYQEGICNLDLPEAEFEVLREQFLEDCYPARFSHFRKTWGYANQPLDGIWLRAPYLHNGSVPDLAALLEPAALRPQVFYIGYDVYDFERVGFVTRPACDAALPQPDCIATTGGRKAVPQGAGWRYDTSLRGNGNGGHEGPPYGTELSPEDKRALIEYLKTF